MGERYAAAERVIVIEGELLLVVGLLEMRIHWCAVGPATSIVNDTDLSLLATFGDLAAQQVFPNCCSNQLASVLDQRLKGETLLSFYFLSRS